MMKNGRYTGWGALEFSQIKSLLTLLYPVLRIANSLTVLAFTSGESFCHVYF